MAEQGVAAAADGDDEIHEEEILRDHLRWVGENPAGVYAVHLHLSRLRPSNRQPNFVRIAARAFETLVSTFDARLFQLSNADMVLVCRDVPVDEVDVPLERVRALFSEDPLTASTGSLHDQFVTWYDLTRTNDFSDFLSAVRQLVIDAQEYRRKAAENRTGATARTLKGRGIDPGDLAALTRKLETMKVADLIHFQPALTLQPNGQGEVLFHEYTVSMPELQKRAAGGVNLYSSPWLFQYLTETLDKRLLLIMARRGLDAAEPAISLNLNIATVLSREFQNFHRAMGARSARVFIEFQLVDVFGDMGAFTYARDNLRDNGYRVVIDGLTPMTLQFFEPAALDADLVKMFWGQEDLNQADEDRTNRLRESLRMVGPDRVVLALAESEEAVKWGLQMGLSRFQGHYVDRIVEAMRAKGLI
ncbi:MAG: hypothetical protein KDE22_00935 [Rhodobacterales bacterium]|nr:hypothetical protein [Rhodobacterales bacterium]